MSSRGENARALILDEFVDDAAKASASARAARSPEEQKCLKEFVAQVAKDMGVPQKNLNEVVETVLATAMARIEAAVRKELLHALHHGGGSSTNGP
jgi:hypothetical protein